MEHMQDDQEDATSQDPAKRESLQVVPGLRQLRLSRGLNAFPELQPAQRESGTGMVLSVGKPVVQGMRDVCASGEVLHSCCALLATRHYR